MLVNHPDDRLRQNNEADGGWNCQQHHEPQRVGESAAKFRFVPERGTARNERERDGRDRDAENPKRQLHQTKRDVEPADRSVAKARGKSAINQHIHLNGARGDHRGPHQNQNRAHA